MMLNYPFFNLNKNSYPYRYYNYSNNPYRPNISYSKKNNQTPLKETIENTEKQTNTKNENKNEQFLSILGIRLYLDDIIILALLFFLYNEGVKDEGLFICLILLLLT